MFFASKYCVEHVPVEYWTETLEASLDDMLVNLNEYHEQIDVQQYISDLSKCLVSFGIRGVVSPLFAGKLEHALEPHLDKIDGKTAENLLFYIDGTGQTRGSSFNASLVSTIQKKKWVEQGALNDHLLLLRLLSKNTNML